MSAMEILVVSGAVTAGVLTATVATVRGLLNDARKRRDRQLFDAYVHDPVALETWLARGALEHIHRALDAGGNAAAGRIASE